jgi:hypothetical protein
MPIGGIGFGHSITFPQFLHGGLAIGGAGRGQVALGGLTLAGLDRGERRGGLELSGTPANHNSNGLKFGGAGIAVVVVPDLIQSAHNQSGSVATPTVSVTWPAATTTGHFLLAVVTVNTPNGAPSVSTPGGWVLMVALDNTPGAQYQKIYYLANAGSQSATGNFVATPVFGNASMNVQVGEFANILTSSPNDKNASAKANSTNPSSGNTAVLSQASELIIATCATDHNSTITAAAAGFAVVDSYAGVSTGAGVWTSTWAWKKVNSTAAQSVVFTDTISHWAAIVSTFKHT